MAKLKTYEAEIDGLHQWVVAAPNQRAALDALGVHQDLFAQGLARVSDDPVAQEAAAARPGVPLRRLKGSAGAFSPVESSGLDAWAQAAAAMRPKAEPAKPAAAPPPSRGKPTLRLILPPPPPPPPPSRSELDRAEAALRKFESKAAADLDKLARALAELEDRKARLKGDQKAERASLAKALEEARSAYRRAGGEA